MACGKGAGHIGVVFIRINGSQSGNAVQLLINQRLGIHIHPFVFLRLITAGGHNFGDSQGSLAFQAAALLLGQPVGLHQQVQILVQSGEQIGAQFGFT
ncbi:hypothetical protein D3C86_1873830 [compost metagenome]